MSNPVKLCEWDYCPKNAVSCVTYGEEYCAEHISEAEDGAWCESKACKSCDEARVEDAINAALQEAEEEETGESFTRTCLECDDDFTPSVEHAKDGVCDECVSEKSKKQILIKSIA